MLLSETLETEIVSFMDFHEFFFVPQNSKGSVEVAAKCFYRRKDLPANLLAAADRHASE